LCTRHRRRVWQQLWFGQLRIAPLVASAFTDQLGAFVLIVAFLMVTSMSTAAVPGAEVHHLIMTAVENYGLLGQL
jgi:Na+/H+-dicarboxylate symporter